MVLPALLDTVHDVYLPALFARAHTDVAVTSWSKHRLIRVQIPQFVGLAHDTTKYG